MRPSTSLAASLVTSLWAVFMAQPVQALNGALPTVSMGCYMSAQGLILTNTSIRNSAGFCQETCFPLGKAVMAMTGGDECWCGDTMPNLSDQVGSGNCSQGCDAYPDDHCGSPKGLTPVYWSVYNSGVQPDVVNNQTADTTSSSSASGTATSTSGPAAVTAPGQTVVVTASSSPAPSSSGPSTAGIAAGVVVGIIAIGAIGGGVWFYMRAKARRELEEEHKRQATVNAFIASGKPGSAGSSHDTRLDPVIMTQRRMSDGSIADNQDYSRRILKVTNA